VHAAQAAAQTTAVEAAFSLAHAGQKVLLVEPSRAQAVIVRNLLQELGVGDIRVARSGAEALEMAKRERPSIAISAMHLPDMTGVQLAHGMRADGSTSGVGFVLITSQGDSERLSLSDTSARTVRLPKPFDREGLAQALGAAGNASPQTPAPSSDALARLRTLIVDDSAAARVHVRGVLQSLGLSHFVEAADGARAVAALAGDRFDLIITDYNMPYMDGRGLVGFLKQNPATAAIPIVMVTTETDPNALAAVRTLGVAAVCDKSFPPEAILSIIDGLVHKP
jgi:two-component system chemotaxis response regulator CheY